MLSVEQNDFPGHAQDYALAFQRGEEKGFTYFFNTYYKALSFYAWRMVQDRERAEEIAGDAFIKIWERYETFSNPRVIKSWLYTTVRHACLDWIRQRKSLTRQADGYAELIDNDVEASIFHDIVRAEVLRELHAAIQKLPPQCSLVFRLLYIQGKSLQQVADEMGLSIHTIKNQRARGLDMLKKLNLDYVALLWSLLMLEDSIA